MHRSSPSIASLAAALAKAQAELVNPEKSLVATIASGHLEVPTTAFDMRRCRVGSILSSWWQNASIDPSTVARSLWLETHQSLGRKEN